MDSADLRLDQGAGKFPLPPSELDFLGLVRTTIGERSNIWDVEQNFVKEPYVDWMNLRWRHAFAYGALYIVIVFGGQQIMKSRERFELRSCLFLWNIGLASFSIMGASRCLPEFFTTLFTKGFRASVVDSSFYDGASGFWVLCFSLSKIVELGDTFFIVLRKQQLIFLHWYHHITVLLYCWNSYSEQTATGRWYVTMNYSIHSMMYTYYALRAMKFRIPKWVNIIITSLQILQMFVGTALGFYVLHLKLLGIPVHQTWRNLAMSMLVYISYFALFAHFFYTTYVVNKRKPDPKKEN